MPRDGSAALFAALEGPNPRPFRAVEAFFPSATLRLWTGRNIRTILGEEYVGAGSIIGFGDIDETGTVEATGTRVTLSGIDPALIALAMAEPYQGSLIKLYLGDMSVTNSMLEMGTGIIDTMEIEDTPASTLIHVNVENILIDLRRSRPMRYTHEDQQLLYPGDMAFEFVTQIQDMTLKVS